MARKKEKEEEVVAVVVKVQHRTNGLKKDGEKSNGKVSPALKIRIRLRISLFFPMHEY